MYSQRKTPLESPRKILADKIGVLILSAIKSNTISRITSKLNIIPSSESVKNETLNQIQEVIRQGAGKNNFPLNKRILEAQSKQATLVKNKNSIIKNQNSLFKKGI